MKHALSIQLLLVTLINGVFASTTTDISVSTTAPPQDEYEAYEGYKCSISGLSAYLPYKTMDDAKNKCNVDENCLGVLRYRSSNFGTKYYACSYPNGIMQDKRYDFYMKKLNLPCMSVKLRKADPNNQEFFDRKWKLGPCGGPKSFPSLWPIPKEADLIYFEKCCLATGIYTLICNNDLGPFGWGNSFIEILGERYCDDFVGYKGLRRVVISDDVLHGNGPNATSQEDEDKYYRGKSVDGELEGTEPNANTSLVPIRPVLIGCPKGTIDGITTCFCEDHCSWNVCRLKHPPMNCPMVMSWQWYSEGMHWMAQSTYLEIPDKICSPKAILAEAGTPLSNVKELCAVDSTCMYFYESVVVRGYWKCSSSSILEYGRGLTLFSKGLGSIKNDTASEATTIKSVDENDATTKKAEDNSDLQRSRKIDFASFMSDHEWKIKFCLCGVAFFVGVMYLLYTPGEVMKEPKILLPRLGKIFQFCCLLLALYYITKFSSEFSENKDLISISMKTFNGDPDDKYPSFTMCFQGDKFHWYNDENIFDSYALNGTQYELMLKGKRATMSQRDEISKLYVKKPVVFGNHQNVNFTSFYVRPEDFIYELKFFTEKSIADASFLNDRSGNQTLNSFLHLGYQTAEKICFTRNSNDALKTIRLHDLITFDSSVIKRYEDTDMEIYIHHPNHLIKSFDKPKYKASFRYLLSILKPNDDGPKTLEFKISQIKQLRKRSDSPNPCTKRIVNYDEYYREQLTNQLGCNPPYWMNTFSNVDNLESCRNDTVLQEAYSRIADPEALLEQLKFPCYEMILLSIDSINNAPSPKPTDMSIAFFYTEKTYEEIIYSRMMNIDGWISNVGGFVGIFLGCSMLQIPEFLVFIMAYIKAKNKTLKKDQEARRKVLHEKIARTEEMRRRVSSSVDSKDNS